MRNLVENFVDDFKLNDTTAKIKILFDNFSLLAANINRINFAASALNSTFAKSNRILSAAGDDPKEKAKKDSEDLNKFILKYIKPTVVFGLRQVPLTEAKIAATVIDLIFRDFNYKDDRDKDIEYGDKFGNNGAFKNAMNRKKHNGKYFFEVDENSLWYRNHEYYKDLFHKILTADKNSDEYKKSKAEYEAFLREAGIDTHIETLPVNKINHTIKRRIGIKIK